MEKISIWFHLNIHGVSPNSTRSILVANVNIIFSSIYKKAKNYGSSSNKKKEKANAQTLKYEHGQTVMNLLGKQNIPLTVDTRINKNP